MCAAAGSQAVEGWGRGVGWGGGRCEAGVGRWAGQAIGRRRCGRVVGVGRCGRWQLWQQPLNRATPYVAAAGHSPSSAMGQTAVPPTPLHRTSVSPPPGLGDAQLPETRFCRKSPPQERISSAPGRPEKHHEHRFAQHPLSKIQRADVRLLGGYLRQE